MIGSNSDYFTFQEYIHLLILQTFSLHLFRTIVSTGLAVHMSVDDPVCLRSPKTGKTQILHII